MNKYLIALSTAITILFVTWQAFAQVNCEYDIQNAACMGYQRPGNSGSGGSGTSRPEIIHVYLKNRYGAVAENTQTGVISLVNNFKCRESAEKAAVEKCGGEGCKATYFRNTCLAVAYGVSPIGKYPNSKYLTFTNGDSDLSKAVSITLKDCQASGATQCQIINKGCSLPVQK